MNTRQYVFSDFETNGLSDNAVPIEVGLVFCNEKLEILELYSDYIYWPHFDGRDNWDGEEASAFQYHTLSLNFLREHKDNTPEVVAKRIAKLVLKHYNFTSPDGTILVSDKKPVLCSDNAIFEFKCLKRLFKEGGMNFYDMFHYCVRDTGVLSDFFGVDTKGNHTALLDAIVCRDIMLRVLSQQGKL